MITEAQVDSSGHFHAKHGAYVPLKVWLDKMCGCNLLSGQTAQLPFQARDGP